MRILVIEDDPNLNNQIKQSLEDSGYSVDTASDGEEGHFLGDTEPYDAVVLDLGLPKIDGITVLEKWRKEKKNFPVFFYFLCRQGNRMDLKFIGHFTCLIREVVKKNHFLRSDRRKCFFLRLPLSNV